MARDLAGIPDPQLRRIVATVDAMAKRGATDALIEPFRQRLRALRPPRPLRFARLLFHPLDPLIIPASGWKPDQTKIPRTVLGPMSAHVHLVMGADAASIETRMIGRTIADTELIAGLGRTLWPAAGRILGDGEVPSTWATTGLSELIYPQLAAKVAALLGQAVPVQTLCSGTANGLLPPDPELIGAMLRDVASKAPAALVMLIALLLVRLPEAVAAMLPGRPGPETTAIQTALDSATDQVLQQLDDEEDAEAQIAAGTLSDAGAAAGRISALLAQLESGAGRNPRREKLRTLRLRLDASCRARFTLGLQDNLLSPLQNPSAPLDPAAISGLESIARGLRILEREARNVGGGATYDFLLRKATETVQDSSLPNQLTAVDRIRLTELLAGPEEAMALMAKAAFRPDRATRSGVYSSIPLGSR